MAPVVVAAFFLFFIPFRLTRGFSGIFRVSVLMIIGVKLILMVILNFNTIETYGIGVQLDASVDAKKYYDFGQAFEQYHLWEISHNDLIRERNAETHLGYPVLNMLAFQFSPDHPMLFLRILKLLFFHAALGMLTVTWRKKFGLKFAYIGYLILGVILYQFYYYHFRNLKDDIILSLFIAIMALADDVIGLSKEERKHVSPRRMTATWIAIAVFIWCISTIRFYLAIALVGAFAANLVTGRGMKMTYRVLLVGVVFVGFAGLMGAAGWQLVEERGSGIRGAVGNIYGLYKVFVSPLPWQHGNWFLAIPHTFYLLSLPIVLWAFFYRIRDNLDWKVYIVLMVAFVVGGMMDDYEPRKRYVMYPIFLSWSLSAFAKRRQAEEAEVFDPQAYFARAGNVVA